MPALHHGLSHRYSAPMAEPIALVTLEWMKANHRLHALVMSVQGQQRGSDEEISQAFAEVEMVLEKLRVALAADR